MSTGKVPLQMPVQRRAKSFFISSKMARAAFYGGLVACAGAIMAFASYIVVREFFQKRSFCCSDVVQLLASVSNRSINPCFNFMDFACWRRKHLDDNALGVNAMETSVVRPTLLGHLRTSAAARLQKHHRSCLMTLVEGAITAENAVRAVVSLFLDWSGGSRHFDLVKVLGLLHLRYNVLTVFAVSFSLKPGKEGTGDSRTSLRIVATYAPRVLSSPDAGHMENRMAEFLAVHLPQVSNQTSQISPDNFRRELLRANFRLQDSLQVFDDVVRMGGLDLLQSQFPKHDLGSWREIINDCCSSWNLEIQDPRNVLNVLNVLTDGATSHEGLVAYFAITTAASVFFEELALDAPTTKITSRARFCDTVALRWHPMWDVVAAEVLTDDERDEVVRATFGAAKAAVVADVAGMFANYTDFDRAREFLWSIGLVLPKSVAHPYTTILPNVTESYVDNKFAIRHFLFKTSVVDAARGLGGLWRLRALGGFAARVGRSVVVSPHVYPMLSVDKGSRAVVNAAVLGVSLADSLWDAFFARRDWSTPLVQRLDAHLSCLHRYVRAEFGGRLSYPLLSLRSAVRAVAGQDWHARAAEGPWKLSASQVFFMLFFLRHACATRDNVKEEPALRARPVVTRLADFTIAFDCRPLPVLGPGSCL